MADVDPASVADVCREVLSRLGSDPRAGLGSESDATRRDRLDSVQVGNPTRSAGEAGDLPAIDVVSMVVRIDSAGLSLDHKIVVERALLTELNRQWPHGDPTVSHFTVYFRRRVEQAAAPGDDAGAARSPRGPQPLAQRASTLGLRVDRRAIPGVRSVIVVASGKGGVGKSTVSTNLAAGLARLGQRVGLLDADIYGPSGPLMLGLSGALPVAPGGRIVPLERHGVRLVSFGFMSDAANPVIWRGPMVSKALEQLCYSTEWGELDYLIVDLPPGTGDVQLTLIERLPIAAAVIVTTPQDVALLDAAKAHTMFAKMSVRVLGLVENMAAAPCSHCGHVEDVFGTDGAERFAESRSLEVLAKIPLDRRVRIGGDSGTPVVTGETPSGAKFMELAELVATRTGARFNPILSHVPVAAVPAEKPAQS